MTSSKQNSKLLYIDAANYTGNFFRYNQRWNLTKAEKGVKKFCNAGKRSGFTMTAFIDQAAMSKEAQQKWRKRREREVRKGERKMPQGALRLLGDMLAKHGVEVRYSVEADCDDTIAFHAQADGASILSQDRDFLRYKKASYALYKDYMIAGGRLYLVKQDGSRKSSCSWRDLGSPPETGCHDAFRDCKNGEIYLRGSPSPLVDMGSLHILVRPLRAALYYHLGVDSVIEEFPIRSEKDCVWDKHEVHSDDACFCLLMSAADAVEFFEQNRPGGASNEDWFKHQFAFRSIVSEICCAFNGSTLLETLLPLIDSIDASPKQAEKKKQPQVALIYPAGKTKKEKREYRRLFPTPQECEKHVSGQVKME